MSDRQEFAKDDEHDAAVSSAYRSGATEKVPGHLDRMVLTAARREASRRITTTGLPRWFVPAAFAAVLALSLSFNLEFSQPDTAPDVQDQAGAKGNGIAASPADATYELETAVESTGRNLRALDDAASSLAAGNKPTSAPASVPGIAPDSAPESARGSKLESPTAGAVNANRSCGTVATTSAETWWSCIEALQRSGQAEAARAELDLLQAAFPDHRPAQ